MCNLEDYSQTNASTADGRKAMLSAKVFGELVSFVTCEERTYEVPILVQTIRIISCCSEST